MMPSDFAHLEPGDFVDAEELPQVPCRPASVLTRELLPVAGGEIGFGMLLVLLIVHFLVAWFGPDENGHLFRAGWVVEGIASSLLVVGPLLVAYAGLRSAIRDRDCFLPYMAMAGGGFISTLTILGLFLAA
jgi:hypothetical protein